MARFPRNAQFRHARVKARCDILLPGLAGGGMTVDTTDVPNLNPSQDTWVFQEGAAARHPAFLLKQINEGEIVLLISMLVVHPVSLHVMRASQHRDAPMHTGSAGL